ncbi:hypothetical protein E4U47_006275 [Claviceps purpurea]|nr:hypothetical protein E4U47_006275 [Claviceps purpurea]
MDIRQSADLENLSAAGSCHDSFIWLEESSSRRNATPIEWEKSLVSFVGSDIPERSPLSQTTSS